MFSFCIQSNFHAENAWFLVVLILRLCIQHLSSCSPTISQHQSPAAMILKLKRTVVTIVRVDNMTTELQARSSTIVGRLMSRCS